jgi:phosphoglycerol transferase
MEIPQSTRPARSFNPARICMYSGAILLLCLNYWINRFFGRPDLDQIAYHLQFGTELLGASDPALVRRFVRWCVLVPLLLLAAVLLAEGRYFSRRRRPDSRVRNMLPALALVAAVGLWLVQLSVVGYVAARFGPDYFGAHYVPPSSVAVRAHKPKNLVLIYVESLESGYSDRRVFGEDLIAPLSRLAATRFDSYQQVPGTGWTIAALVATQCAVPLKRMTVFDVHTQGEVVPAFLPQATCLGDILARHGYRNVFMGGGSPAFTGKGKFLRAHHYHEVLGKEDWQRAGVPASAMNGWGLFDDDLLARARARLDQLHASRQPFNLTLLTVTSHEPAGYLSPGCARRGYAGFDGVIRCAAADVAAFVDYAAGRGYLDDTNIVIVGDHLARRNPLSAGLDSLSERSVFNAFIGTRAPARNRGQLVHFDLLPTILEFNGFAVEGGRLGLGYSAFNRHALQPDPRRVAELRASVLNHSPVYRALWIP